MKKFQLSYYILGAMVLGALFGYLFPVWGVAIKPFGDAFIRLIKMIVIPVIVSTLLVGVAGAGDIKSIGRLGVKTIIWFEVITTFILFVGLTIGNIVKPGAGIVIGSLAKADITAIAGNTKAVLDTKTLLLNIIPTNIVDVLAKGDLLAVIFFCVMFGLALIKMGSEVKPLIDILDLASKASFKLVSIVMVVSPIGVFALTSATVGTYGVKVLLPLIKFIGTAYLGLAILVFVLFPLVGLFLKVSVKQVYKLIWDLLLIGGAAGTVEPILPELMLRLNKFGVPKNITSFVIPLGLPLNSDGVAIYLTIAGLFIAQAFGVHMTWQQQLYMVFVFMITSKGIAAVPSGSIVVLLATAGIVGLPPEGVALVLGIDRVIDMVRTATNIVGHTFASIAIAKWEGVFVKRSEVEVHNISI